MAFAGSPTAIKGLSRPALPLLVASGPRSFKIRRLRVSIPQGCPEDLRKLQPRPTRTVTHTGGSLRASPTSSMVRVSVWLRTPHTSPALRYAPPDPTRKRHSAEPARVASQRVAERVTGSPADEIPRRSNPGDNSNLAPASRPSENPIGSETDWIAGSTVPCPTRDSIGPPAATSTPAEKTSVT